MYTSANSQEEAARALVKKLQDRGFEAVWAGGCVRDMLRGVTPNDYDIATNALPEAVKAVFDETVEVGKQFGVIIVRHKNHDFEVATFRADQDYRDGRHPEQVIFTTAREDAFRRDFTINAIFFDPVSGIFHDFVGGQKDIKKKLIRCVGEPLNRFKEDHLRILRALRFASVLEFSIETDTEKAISKHAQLLEQVSPERIAGELTRTLTESPKAGQSMLMALELGILAVILPEVSATVGQEQPPQFHPEGDVFNHTKIMLDEMSNPSPALAYSVLFHDIGKPGTAENAEDRIRFNGHASLSARMAIDIMRRLRMPKNLMDIVHKAIKDHMRFMDVPRMKQSTLRKLVGSPTYEVELELHRLDCLASHGDLSNYHFLREFAANLSSEPPLPKSWITGHDIMQSGIAQGPEIGLWLNKAYDAQLEGRFSNRSELLTWLQQQIKEKQ